MDINLEIQKAANYWATSEAFDPETRAEVSHLIETGQTKELIDRFYQDLEFGTGGMRGIMGAGTARMNVYNIRKATMALAIYLKKVFGEQELAVAISYDSRINSEHYAKTAASVLIWHGIRVYITSQMRPTPMLSFMVRKFKCHAGICITASHNPPEYNGYKVYWQTGGQLVPPHDLAIVKIYKEISGYEGLKFLEYERGLTQGSIKEVSTELDDAYFDELKQLSLHPIQLKDFKVVYSPLHGTGIFAVPKALQIFGCKNVILVEEQSMPDGNFPTVSSPNPEDPKALELAMKWGKNVCADIILATDPDSDRIAVVVNENGKFVQFNGNQLGCLLNYYVLSSLKELKKLPDCPLIIKTVVTTDLQKDIAHEFGAKCDETLTGFKWICDRIEQYESGNISPYAKFVCGGEESYGFLAGHFVRDKDAIIGCALAAEMVAYFKHQGKTLTQVLDDLFLRHGVYQESLKTYTLPGKEGADRINEMMTNLRKTPLLKVANLEVQKVIDFQTGVISELKEGHWQPAGESSFPRSNVLQYVLKGGSKISIRPSGTEPKIKIYTSIKEDTVAIKKIGLDAVKNVVQTKVLEVEKDFTALLENKT